MAEATEEVVGRALPTALSVPGIPEYTDLSDAEIAEFVENKSGPRRQPYVVRLLAFEKRVGRVISPYDHGLAGYLEDEYPDPDAITDWE